MIFFGYDYYEDIMIKFNELPHDIKESLSEFLNFDKNMIGRCTLKYVI